MGNTHCRDVTIWRLYDVRQMTSSRVLECAIMTSLQNLNKFTIKVGFDCFKRHSNNTRSKERGFSYFCASYVHELELKGNTLSAKCWRSQRKKEEPHSIELLFENDVTLKLMNARCSCTAGKMKIKNKHLLIQQKLSYRFSLLGKLIARHYLLFLFGPVIISAILSTGFLKYKLNRDTDNLFTATNGKAIEIKNLVERLFPMNTSEYFDIVRNTRMNNLCIFILASKTDNNIFNEDAFHEIVVLDKIVKSITVNWNGKKANYSRLCAKKYDKCYESDIMKLIPRIKDIISGNYKIKYPFDLDKLTFYLTQNGLSLGGVKTDSNGIVQEIKAFRLFYILDSSDLSKLTAIKEWKITLNRKLKHLEFQQLSLTYLNSQTLEDELEEYSLYFQPLIPVVIITITIFSTIVCMTNDWITSKPWLGPSACISAGLAIASGFGLMLSVGIESLDVNNALMFALLAMEIDDAFVFIAAWRSTNPEDSVEKRMEKTYSEAAISITVTSVTNFLSFTIGMCSPFPGIRLFNICAGICVCFTYSYLMTFFGSCMVLSGYREQKRLHCFTFRHIKDSRTEETMNSKNNQIENFIMALFRDKIGNMLTKKYIKIIFLLIFFCNIGIAIWGLLHIQAGNDFDEAFKDNSRFSQFMKTNYKYFSDYSYPILLIIDEPINYSDPRTQNLIEELCQKFESHPHIADSSMRISWLKYYLNFQKTNFGKFLFAAYNMTNELEFIDGLRNVFLKFKQAKQFNLDIVFDKNYTKIISSRFLLPSKNIRNEATYANIIADSYDIAKHSSIPVKVYNNQFYLIEQRFFIKQATFQTAIVTSALICIVFFLFIPDIKSVFCITVIVFCIIFETLGYMSLWNAKLDIPGLATLILCVGFSINYPTHISFSFVTAKTKEPNERIKKCLYDVGFPIFQGSLSTVLGVLLLAFLPFYSTVSFFKIVFLIVVQTTFHAMFIIPIILSIVGYLNFSSLVNKIFFCEHRSFR